MKGRFAATPPVPAVPGPSATAYGASLGGLDRNVGLELCRVTEAGALASARWMGRGNKHGVDQAAVNAMRQRLNRIQMDGSDRSAME